MLIFKDEIDCGLADLISKAKTISYVSKLEPFNISKELIIEKFKSVASLDNVLQDDLYPVNSILVSTVWNLNDDVFDKYETILAKDTPINKPTNNNHIEKDIVGHMTGSFCIDDEGNMLDSNLPADDLPDLFHIVNSAVIYNCFSEPDLKENITNLIKQIEAGEKFVSMEASFKGFDYALRDKNGDIKIVTRNPATAFLTKHLRCYGGTGFYGENQVGRLLRGISFIGKGYVDKPANPQSIIFDKNHGFNNHSSAKIMTLDNLDGVFTTVANNDIGVENNMSQELEQKIDELTQANTALSNEITELKNKVESLETDKNNITAELNSGVEEKAKYLVENQTLAQQIVDLSTEKAGLLEQIKVLSETIKAKEEKEKEEERKNKMEAAGYSKEEAIAKLESFKTFSDEQFDLIMSEVGKNKASQNDKGVSNNSDDNSAKASLDNVEPEPVVNPGAVVVPEEVSKANFRKDLAELFNTMLQK